MGMRIGYVGLGKMGKNMVLRLLEQGIEVVVWNRSPQPVEEVVLAGAIKSESLEDLVAKVKTTTQSSPGDHIGQGRIIWVMLTAGDATKEFIQKLAVLLDPGDLIIDGGNSYYKEAIEREKELQEKGIHFMDIGTSGGPGGARIGACLMIGGERQDFEKALPVIKAAAAPNAYQHLGPVGAGHFVKMIHNGVEYGMMQAIAEGVAILDKSELDLDLAQCFDLYQHQSVVTSRLVGWMQEVLKEDQKLESYSSKIGRTGEGDWTVQTARELEVEIPVIEKSVQVRIDSETEPENIRNKAVSAMRGKFGQHAVKV